LTEFPSKWWDIANIFTKKTAATHPHNYTVVLSCVTEAGFPHTVNVQNDTW